MIKFQTLTSEIDLTNIGITFNEKSNYFSDKITKSYSFPFKVQMHEQIAIDLGIVDLPNVKRYKQKIYGTLIKDLKFYKAYISINNVVGETAELTIFYGDETLKVFDLKLHQLPFPVIDSGGDLLLHATGILDMHWPQTSHNFPKIYRPQIKEKDSYEYFDRFVNNYVYDENTSTWSFPTNSIDLIDGEDKIVNRNVMCPCIYLLEIVKMIFAYEGLEARGDFMNNDFMSKIIYIPKTFMQHYSISDFESYSFSTFTSQINEEGVLKNIYEKTHTPTNAGTYVLNINIAMSSIIAQYFSLTIEQDNNILFEANSHNATVNIDEQIEINVADTQQFEPIIVRLKLKYQATSIVNFNSFVYEFKEGQLNQFPSVYTLSKYVPDMKVREFLNKIKNWLNLKFEYNENSVYINFLDDLPERLFFRDKSHLQQVNPKRSLNKNNLFVMTYPSGDEVIISKNGQIFNKDDYTDDEITALEIDVLPLKVFENSGSFTANYPDEDQDLMFALYHETVEGENVCVDNINGHSLKLIDVYLQQWRNWLSFRTKSESWSDKFIMHFKEQLSIDEGIFKYNKKSIIKETRFKRINTQEYEVTVESETF